MYSFVTIAKINPTYVLIGISTSGESLLFNTGDLGPRLGVYKMPLAETSDLKTLLRQGQERLSIEFANLDQIVDESCGSYYICQYLAQEICLQHQIGRTMDSTTLLNYRIEDVRRHLVDELTARFVPSLVSFVKASGHTSDQWLPYLAIVAAISGIPKSLIWFDEVVGIAKGFEDVVRLVKGKITTLIQDCMPNGQFTKRLYFDEDSNLLSVEDPVFRYFLNYMDLKQMIESFGIRNNYSQKILDVATEAHRKYFDIEQTEETKTERKEVFISYSHRDREWLEKLQTTMAPLLRNNRISVWSDTQIIAGSQWRDEIESALSRAGVAVLLVSPSFLASDFISSNELPTLLAAAKSKGVKIAWILISACLYEFTEIASYQAAWDPSRPLDSLSSSEINKAFVDIVKKIIDAVEGV